MVDFADFEQITRRRYEYALGIDTRDWELYRSVFADEIVMDFSKFSGVPMATLTAEAWIERVKPLFTGLDATQHMMTNPIVDVFGETATCKMYMQAAHVLDLDGDPKTFTLGGYYEDVLDRHNAKWLIRGVTLNVMWATGNSEIMDVATERGKALLN